jgi:hypothetical protein
MTRTRTCLALCATLALLGCATPDGMRREAKPVAPPPKITETTPLNEALEAAIDHGGDTLAEVKRLVKRRGEGEKAVKLVVPAIHDGMMEYEPHQLLNAGNLLSSLPGPLPRTTFKELIASTRPLARQLGWQLAATKPGAEIARTVDEELTRAVRDNDLDSVMLPQMANAVRANKLKSAYTLVRRGLLEKGDEEFAHAMFEVNPAKASDDALRYLALAPAEELRQLTLSSVNLYTVVAILRKYQTRPPGIAAPGFESLVVYAVSRNTALAELAQNVLETYVPQRTEVLASAVAKQPAWVQVAYLENARQKMNPKLGLILSELKKVTSEDDVVREIDEIRF